MSKREKVLGLVLVGVVAFAGWETSHGRGQFKANATEAQRLHHNFTDDTDPRPLREVDVNATPPVPVSPDVASAIVE